MFKDLLNFAKIILFKLKVGFLLFLHLMHTNVEISWDEDLILQSKHKPSSST